MNTRVSKAVMVIALLAVNIFAVNRAWTLSQEYPFTRLPLENRLHFSSVFNDIREGYGTEIVGINGNTGDYSGKIVSEIASQNVDTITYRIGGTNRTRQITSNIFNIDVFAFIFFILLCGNIHIVWGIAVRNFSPHHVSAKNFSRFSLGLGVYFICLTLFFLLPDAGILIAASALLLIYLTLRYAIMLSSVKKKRSAIRVLSACAGAAFFASFYCSLHFSSAVVLSALNYAIAAATAAAACVIILQIIKNRAIQKKSPLILIAAAFISIIIPFSMIALSFSRDTPLPLSFYASLTIFLPMILGNSIANENTRSILALKRRYFMKISIDLGISLIISMSVFMMFSSGAHSDILFISQVMMIAGFILLLYARRRLLSEMRQYNKDTLGKFTLSLRKISEITASPEKLHLKIDKVFFILREITGSGNLIIELFEEELIRRIEPIPGYIEYNADPVIPRYIKKNRNIVCKNSIQTGGVFGYLNRNKTIRENINIIIPVESDGAVIGILEAGGREDGTPLANEEIQFLSSASILIYQLIENQIL
ncbi:MAG: hypothetical protein ACRCUT_12900, partial [Spirochaetota bacterium]